MSERSLDNDGVIEFQRQLDGPLPFSGPVTDLKSIQIIASKRLSPEFNPDAELVSRLQEQLGPTGQAAISLKYVFLPIMDQSHLADVHVKDLPPQHDPERL